MIDLSQFRQELSVERASHSILNIPFGLSIVKSIQMQKLFWQHNTQVPAVVSASKRQSISLSTLGSVAIYIESVL